MSQEITLLKETTAAMLRNIADLTERMENAETENNHLKEKMEELNSILSGKIIRMEEQEKVIKFLERRSATIARGIAEVSLKVEDLDTVDSYLYSMMCMMIHDQESFRMMANIALAGAVDPAMKKAKEEILKNARKLRNQKNQNPKSPTKK